MRCPPAHPGGQIRLDLLIPTAALLLLAAAVGLALRYYTVRTRVSGDPASIHLSVVRPDCGDSLRDSMGEPLGDGHFYDLDHDQPWNPGQLRRDFIFAAHTGRLVAGAFEIRPSGDDAYQCWRSARLVPGPYHQVQVVAEAAFARWITRRWWFINRRLPVRRVDVHFRFFLALPGQQLAQAAGPFSPGQTQRLPDGSRLTAGTNWNDGRLGSAEFRLVTSNRWNAFPFPVVATDTAGHRWNPLMTRRDRQGDQSVYEFRVPRVPLARIAAVALELPRERTFHNVRVDYPGLPERSFPAYRAAVAAALNWKEDPAQMQALRFRNPEEALQVIHLARGSGVRQVLLAMRQSPGRIRFDTLPNPTRQRVRETARRWSETLGKRVEGVSLGLSGGWSEFVDPALELLADAHREGDSTVAFELAQAAHLLTTADLKRLQELIAEAKPWTEVRRLAACFQTHADPAAWRALDALAQHPQPWIWWPTVALLADSHPAAPPTPPSPELLQRLLLVQQNNPVQYLGQPIPLEAELASAAWMRLPDLFTSEFRRRDPACFLQVYRHLVTRVDRDRATDLIVAHLNEFYRHPDDPNGTTDAWLSASMIQQLNQWHGLDLGSWGNDPEIFPGLAIDPNALADAIAGAVRWHQARR